MEDIFYVFVDFILAIIPNRFVEWVFKQHIAFIVLFKAFVYIVAFLLVVLAGGLIGLLGVLLFD